VFALFFIKLIQQKRNRTLDDTHMHEEEKNKTRLLTGSDKF